MTWFADPGGPEHHSIYGAAASSSLAVIVGYSGAIFYSGWGELLVDGFESGGTGAWTTVVE